MFIARTPNTLTINYTVYDRSKDHPERYRQVPTLRMSGLWMEQYGFRPGDTVALQAEGGVITLRVVRPEALEKKKEATGKQKKAMLPAEPQEQA